MKRWSDKKVAQTFLVVAAIWALELFSVQVMSFDFGYPVPMRKWMGAHAVRLLLDAAFASGCVFLLPRRVTCACFIGFAAFAQIAVYYKAVFGRALTWTTMQAQWAEGIAGARFDWAYVCTPLLLALLTLLAVKFWLLARARPRHPAMRRAGAAAWAVYALTALTAMVWIDPPLKLRSFTTGDRLGMTYGFVLLWAGEAVYLNQEQLLQEAVWQRKNTSDRLSEIEPPLALTGDVVILQVESLDWRVLNHRVGGAPMTPFLNRLADEAMLFKISAFHANGSGDADFLLLNAVPPSSQVMTYNLVHYPYRDTLPQLAASAGYATAAFHGNTGSFFSRAWAFKHMGFDELWFLEELRDTGGLPVSLWGIRDDTLLEFSHMRLQEARGGRPQLHYIITLTSHQPFIYLEPAARLFLPGADTMLDRYFDNMNFVDRHVEQYVGGLAPGTLVIIFGDHRAPVNYASGEDSAQHVPFILHRVGERLAARQVSRILPIAQSGELTMLDAASYVHRLFKEERDEHE
ncbi:MAG: LTA synthase family protein [Kiritimatiellaeota bacterium]|nr:LTA synthase family protein [Kiritimatiellota bacterium]